MLVTKHYTASKTSIPPHGIQVTFFLRSTNKLSWARYQEI